MDLSNSGELANCHVTLTKHSKYLIVVSIAGLLSDETDHRVSPANLKLRFGRGRWFVFNQINVIVTVQCDQDFRYFDSL